MNVLQKLVKSQKAMIWRDKHGKFLLDGKCNLVAEKWQKNGKWQCWKNWQKHTNCVLEQHILICSSFETLPHIV